MDGDEHARSVFGLVLGLPRPSTAIPFPLDQSPLSFRYIELYSYMRRFLLLLPFEWLNSLRLTPTDARAEKYIFFRRCRSLTAEETVD